MASVQVRTLDKDIYEELVRAAKEDDRSIAQQVTYYIRQGLKGRYEPEKPSFAGIVDSFTGEVFPSYQARRKAALKLRDESLKRTGPVQIDFDELNRMIGEDHDARADAIIERLGDKNVRD